MAALSLMVIAVAFGLPAIKRPGRKTAHLFLGLLTFAVTMIHIFAPGGEGRDGPRDFQGRRPPRGSITAPFDPPR